MGASKARKERRKLQNATNAAEGDTSSLHPHIQVREVEDMGRGLFWCPSDGGMLVKGTTLLRLEPEVFLPEEKMVFTRCHVCLSEDASTLMRCAKCEVIQYCSEACKLSDQRVHQEECKAIEALHTKLDLRKEKTKVEALLIPAILRISARLIWMRAYMGGDFWEHIESLPWPKHKADDIEDPYHAIQLSSYLRDPQLKSKDISLRDPIFDLGELQDLSGLLARVTINSFEIRSDGNEHQLGVVFSTVAAKLNHSCDANMVLRYASGQNVKKRLHLVALKHIAAGEQLTISYVDPSDLYPIRQSKLRQRHGFKCKCPMCEEDKIYW